MITAERLTLLINMPTAMLVETLPVKNRPKLNSSKFVGITNGHEFCYSVVNADGVQAKIFLTYDPVAHKVFGKLG